MEFNFDSESSYQDTHYLECCSLNEQKVSIASISLSRNDKELWMKTRMNNDD